MSLTYHPSKNALTIGVLKAKNLKAKDINGKSGRFTMIVKDRARKVQGRVTHQDCRNLLLT